MSYEWFRSLDEIPGVRWEPLVPVDRSKLRGHDATPQVEIRPLYDDKTYLHVEWLLPDGTPLSEADSSDPAVLHSRTLESDRQDLAPRTVAKTISEVLALPSTRSNYHFLMLSAWGSLHKSRGRDVRAFGWIEALCWADITMMEQGPELVFAEDHWDDMPERGGYPVWPAIDQLAGMYQREGFLASAVDLEQRFIALAGAPRGRGENAIARQQALLEEDGR